MQQPARQRAPQEHASAERDGCDFLGSRRFGQRELPAPHRWQLARDVVEHVVQPFEVARHEKLRLRARDVVLDLTGSRAERGFCTLGS